MHLSGQNGAHPQYPASMHTVSCTPPGTNTPRVFVAWDAHVSWIPGKYGDQGWYACTDSSCTGYVEEKEGRIAELDIEGGTSRLLKDERIDPCKEMGDMTASPDCSVVAVTCRSSKQPNQVGAYDLLSQRGVPEHDLGWRNTYCKDNPSDGQCSEKDTRDDSLYLIEWTAGAANGRTVIDHTSNKVRVSAAIGGWPIGSWNAVLNKDKTKYLLDIKVTAGSHEGSLSYAVFRQGWKWDSVHGSDWACGTGHTEGNRVTYNPEMDLWGRLCWTDWNDEDAACAGNERCSADDNHNVWNKGLWATYFQTLPKDDRKEILKLPGHDTHTGCMTHPDICDVNPSWNGAGGLQDMISLGERGWLGFGYRPVGIHEEPADDPIQWHNRQLAVTLANFPPRSNQCTGSQCTSQHFHDLTDLPGHSYWRFESKYGDDWGGLGFVNGQLLRGADESHSGKDEVLIGYATNIRHGSSWPGYDYRVAKVTPDGQVLATLQLDGTGWGEQNKWVRVSTGCVLFPYTWADDQAPGQPYGDYYHGTENRLSDKLRITVLCDN